MSCNHQIVISITVAPLKFRNLVCSNAISRLSICDQSGCESSYMYRGNIVLLTIRFFDVAKFTILTILSLQSWCRLSFQIVSLKISSPPSFVLKSPNRIFYGTLGNNWKPALIPRKNCALILHFCPQVMQANSKQWLNQPPLRTVYETCHQ
jgi:hypothetical protein